MWLVRDCLGSRAGGRDESYLSEWSHASSVPTPLRCSFMHLVAAALSLLSCVSLVQCMHKSKM